MSFLAVTPRSQSPPAASPPGSRLRIARGASHKQINAGRDVFARPRLRSVHLRFDAALAAIGKPKRRQFTYGHGHPSKPKHGKVIDPPVTLDALRRHAKRYGTEGVAEVAREHGLNEAQLLELGVAGTTVNRVQVLAGQGFVAAEIGKRLRLSLPTVRRHMATVGEKPNEAA